MNQTFRLACYQRFHGILLWLFCALLPLWGIAAPRDEIFGLRSWEWSFHGSVHHFYDLPPYWIMMVGFLGTLALWYTRPMLRLQGNQLTYSWLCIRKKFQTAHLLTILQVDARGAFEFAFSHDQVTEVLRFTTTESSAKVTDFVKMLEACAPNVRIAIQPPQAMLAVQGGIRQYLRNWGYDLDRFITDRRLIFTWIIISIPLSFWLVPTIILRTALHLKYWTGGESLDTASDLILIHSWWCQFWYPAFDSIRSLGWNTDGLLSFIRFKTTAVFYLAFLFLFGFFKALVGECLIVQPDAVTYQKCILGIPIFSKSLPLADICKAVTTTGPSNKKRVSLVTPRDERLTFNIALLDCPRTAHAFHSLLCQNQYIEIDDEINALHHNAFPVSYTQLWLQSMEDPQVQLKMSPLGNGAFIQDRRYQIIKMLKQGGEGILYLARTESGMEVVVKERIFPHAFIPDDSSLEADLISHLKHDSIVQIMDHFSVQNRSYLILEKLSGQSIREIRNATELKIDRIMTISLVLCSILKYLHLQGVVHGDFSPDNLVETHSQKIKLIDFGTAGRIAQGRYTSGALGNMAYMAPEQFAGEANSLGDIYSLGCTVFFLVCGIDPVPLTESQLPQPIAQEFQILNEVIQKCTKQDPIERYQSVSEVINALTVPTTLLQEDKTEFCH